MSDNNNHIDTADQSIDHLLEATQNKIEDVDNDIVAKQENDNNGNKDDINDDNDSALEELKKVIEETAREDERPGSASFTLSKILGGDILSTEAIRRQVWLIILIALFTVVYVSNRYNCQKKLIEIDKLENKLQNAKYKALSISSELTELSRESNVLEQLKANNDTTLKISSQPPYIVTVDE